MGMHRLGITCVVVLIALSPLFGQNVPGGATGPGGADAGFTGPPVDEPAAVAQEASGFSLPEPAVPVKVADAHVERRPADHAPVVDHAPALSPRQSTADGLALPQFPPVAEDERDAEGDRGAVPAAYSFPHRQDTRLDPGAPGRIGPAPPPAVLQEPSPEPDPEPEELILVWPEAARNAGGVVSERQVIAYYGHPFSRLMGILGESPIEDMAADLLARAAEYDALNGEIGVAPAFHIIYGTVYEDASIGILRESKLLEYIRFAEENDIIVFLDHQIGRYTVREAIEKMLPYLAYEHVHLAIDPEWATTQPGKVIGQVHADEINEAQQMMSDYMKRHGIPGPRMLVVHQFTWRMIADREQIRTDYDGVQLIHNADGFGHPAEKYVSWEFNVRAANMPLKGFKLFYPKSWRDGGYDDPLLSPRDVLQLEPVPVYIQYQ